MLSLSKAHAKKHAAPKNLFIEKARQRLEAGYTVISEEMRQKGLTNWTAVMQEVHGQDLLL